MHCNVILLDTCHRSLMWSFRRHTCLHDKLSTIVGYNQPSLGCCCCGCCERDCFMCEIIKILFHTTSLHFENLKCVYMFWCAIFLKPLLLYLIPHTHINWMDYHIYCIHAHTQQQHTHNNNRREPKSKSANSSPATMCCFCCCVLAAAATVLSHSTHSLRLAQVDRHRECWSLWWWWWW